MASVILDASVLIALYSSRDGNHGWAIEFFKRTLDHDLKMSVLNYAECMVHPTRAGKLQQFKSGVTGLGIEIIGLESNCGQELARLRAETSLKMPDALVVYEALKSTAVIATTDLLLAKTGRMLSLEVFSPKF